MAQDSVFVAEQVMSRGKRNLPRVSGINTRKMKMNRNDFAALLDIAIVYAGILGTLFWLPSMVLVLVWFVASHWTMFLEQRQPRDRFWCYGACGLSWDDAQALIADQSIPTDFEAVEDDDRYGR